jgi:hypothetical protein
MGHTNGAVGSLIVLVVDSRTGECCDSEERSHADQFGRHCVGEIVCGEMSGL